MDQAQLLKDKNFAPKDLGDVCVLGLGKTGNVVASYMCTLLGKRVNSVHVYAGEKKEFAMRAGDRLLKAGATVSFDDKEIKHKYDLCITSPGISENDPLIKTAKQNCVEVISEIEFAWRESDTQDTWIAVTGTNGKTTTTSLINSILNFAGKHACEVGNIGNVALDVVASNMKKSKYEQTNIYVTEVSSYQLALCDKFAPQISVLLNITPDHIDWHGSFDKYTKAKLRVFDNATCAVLNMDDKVVSSKFNTIKDNVNEVIENSHDDENIIVNVGGRQHIICPITDMKIIGEHNCVNARAAASVCLKLGVSDEQIAEALKNFQPIEHRLESCGIVAGIRLYNDSKATNVDSVLYAIDAFEKKKAIFILGGRDKNTNIDELVDKCLENLKGVVCYGEASDRFFDSFKSKLKDDSFILEKAHNMGTAFKTSMEKAFPGDYVVLSPACSSFDEFDNFEERGRAFKALVEKCKQ